MAEGEPPKKSPWSFINSARNGGTTNGASFTGQRPCSPVQVVTPMATQCRHSSICAWSSSTSELRRTRTRSQSAQVASEGCAVEYSQTGTPGAPWRTCTTAVWQAAGDSPKTAATFLSPLPARLKNERTELFTFTR